MPSLQDLQSQLKLLERSIATASQAALPALRNQLALVRQQIEAQK